MDNVISMVLEKVTELKALKVPELMKQGDEKKLNRLLSKVDYSQFADGEYPETTVEKLGLTTEDDALATVMFVYGNIWWPEGDSNLFKDYMDFNRFLKRFGELCQNIANLQSRHYLIKTEIPLSKLLGKKEREIY